MIEIFRTKNHKILPYIASKLNGIEGSNPKEDLEGMLIRMAQDPEQVMAVVCFESETIKAFIFGYLTRGNKAFIDVAWCEPTLPKEYKLEVFEKFIAWAKENGKTSLEAVTQRNTLKAWEKLYGMTEHAIILQKEI